MRATSVLLPVLVVAAVGGAFFAGNYIGSYDAQKRASASAHILVAQQNAHDLFILGKVADLLHESKPTEALQLLEQFARLKVPAVTECLGSRECEWWLPQAKETQEALRRYLSAYGATSGAQTKR
jgi:hypothetical protein